MVKNLLNLFFPKVCLACKYMLTDNEDIVCTKCRHELPATNFHFDLDKKVADILYGRVQFVDSTALLHFYKKGIVQELMHNLKYRGHEEIGVFLGKWLGSELTDASGFNDIDVVIPVPIHKSRLRKRGYNQVSKFGEEIANKLNAEFNETILIRSFATKTQVFQDRIGRSIDNEAKFSINDFEYLKNKHILLVDDIITTGATIESCATVLNQIEGVKLSLATMAITD
ncbi:comF family protein [Flavobacteriaceae bacterium MAR_2010_188]|nr:comF family protein [Flavobacteriaceae bacterium MAR_2010_188]